MEENFLKVLLYGEEEFSSKINFDILKSTIEFIKKNQIALVAHYFFLNFFPSDQVLNIFLCILCSIMYRIYINQYLSYVDFVSSVASLYYFYF